VVVAERDYTNDSQDELEINGHRQTDVVVAERDYTNDSQDELEINGHRC
jgi:hypothetical protein